MLLAFSACVDCFHDQPYLTPYQHHADFICPTFPFCYQELVTGAWKSQLKTEETKGSVTLNVQRDIESSECLKNGHYCRSDASKLISSIQLETAEECNDKCIAEESCLVFSFHIIRGQGYCSLLTECLYESKCGEDEKCATGQKIVAAHHWNIVQDKKSQKNILGGVVKVLIHIRNLFLLEPPVQQHALLGKILI